MPNWCYATINLDYTYNTELLDSLRPHHFISENNITEYKFKKWIFDMNDFVDIKDEATEDFFKKSPKKWSFEIKGKDGRGVMVFNQYFFAGSIERYNSKIEITGELKWGPDRKLIDSTNQYTINNGISCEMQFAEPGMQYVEFFKLLRKPVPNKIKHYIQEGLKNNEPLLEKIIEKYIEPVYEPLIDIAPDFKDYDENKKYNSDNDEEDENFYHNNMGDYLRQKYPKYPQLAEIWGFWE